MGGIFISHASADDDFVAELRQRVEERGLAVWVDSRQLRGGDGLAPEIGLDPRFFYAVILAPCGSNYRARPVRALHRNAHG